jgi:cystathionine beta-lyase
MTKAIRALALDELRKRKSSKWRHYPNDVLPLPVAEMDFPMAPAVKAGLQDMLDRSDTGYLKHLLNFLKAVGTGNLIQAR